ncbi:MAG: FAD-dependent oxidoreductase [Nitrososphaerota archaeon]
MAAFGAIVMGGGHNGLVAACYLAKAGLRVLVVERRPVLGGACTTEELWPGVRINRLAYAYSLFRPEIVKELELERHGLAILTPEVDVAVPLGKGRHLLLYSDPAKTAKEIAKFSARDARAWEDYRRFWREAGQLFGAMMLAPPPSLRELAALLEEASASELAKRLLFYSAKELLDEFFEAEEVKAALMARGIIGTMAGPSTPGTAFVLGYHVMGEAAGEQGAWGYVKGGMGSLALALASALRELGGSIMTGIAVRRILISQGRAMGVELEDGRRLEARLILSNADPKTTLLRLVGEEHLSPELARRLRSIKDEGCVAKLNGLLRGLPRFRDLEGASAACLQGIIGIGPSWEYYERAYFEALMGGFSSRPIERAVFHTVLDPSLAPPGYHTLSIFSQYFPYSLKRGWEAARQEAAEAVLGALEEFAPGLRGLLERYELLTPLDMEREFSLPRGNIFHAELIPSQMLALRPLPELSGYRTPIGSLYLCGSALHPGGGVTGAPGYVCAQQALKDLRGTSAARP